MRTLHAFPPPDTDLLQWHPSPFCCCKLPISLLSCCRSPHVQLLHQAAVMDVDGVIFITASSGNYNDGTLGEIVQIVVVRVNKLERRFHVDRMKLRLKLSLVTCTFVTRIIHLRGIPSITSTYLIGFGTTKNRPFDTVVHSGWRCTKAFH